MNLRSLLVVPFLLAAGVAGASPITWSFGGKVVEGYGVEPGGRTVEGSITLNLDFAQPCQMDGPTASHLCLVKTDGARHMAGSAFDGLGQITVVEQANQGGTNLAVYRNAAAGYGGYNTYYVGASNATLSIDVFIQDTAGLDSEIFVDKNGGLRWDQPINWFAPSAYAQIRLNSSSYYETAQLDWITTTIDGVSVTQTRPQPPAHGGTDVPEPATHACFALGLVALAWAWRLRNKR